MSALTFDTLSASRILTASGIPQRQAEAVTQVVKQAQDAHLEELATKEDLANTKLEIIKWVAGMLLAQTGVIATLVKLL